MGLTPLAAAGAGRDWAGSSTTTRGRRASSMTRACSPSASTGPSGSTHAARTCLASGHGFMVRSADPSNRSGKYCQSRTRVSVSEPLVRRPRGRVSEPSPWSRSSFTVLLGRTVGREHRSNSRSVHVHSAATRGSHTSPSLRLRTFPFPVRPTRANVDGRRLLAAATKEGPSP